MSQRAKETKALIQTPFARPAQKKATPRVKDRRVYSLMRSLPIQARQHGAHMSASAARSSESDDLESMSPARVMPTP